MFIELEIKGKLYIINLDNVEYISGDSKVTTITFNGNSFLQIFIPVNEVKKLILQGLKDIL